VGEERGERQENAIYIEGRGSNDSKQETAKCKRETAKRDSNRKSAKGYLETYHPKRAFSVASGDVLQCGPTVASRRALDW
jgi:hypothetical protein